MKNQKGFSTVLVVIIILVIITAGGAVVYNYVLPEKEAEDIKNENQKPITQPVVENNYSFKSFEEGDLSEQQYFDYSVGIYKNQKLIKRIAIKDTHEKPSLFVLSPDKKYVAFRTMIGGGSCVWIASPMVIDLDDFSLIKLDDSDVNKKIKNVLGVDPNEIRIKFSASSDIKDIKWISKNKIEATMKFGDNSGCPIGFTNKPVNSPNEIEIKAIFTLTNEKIAVSNEKIAVSEKEISTAETQKEIASWQTYRNEKYEYEVKYPVSGNFTLIPSGIKGANDEGYIVDFKIKDLDIRVQSYSNIRNDSTIEELSQRKNDIIVASIPYYAEKILIGEKPAFKWVKELSSGKKVGAISIVFNGGAYYYEISVGDQSSPEFTDEKENTYILFLSTFKFTK